VYLRAFYRDIQPVLLLGVEISYQRQIIIIIIIIIKDGWIDNYWMFIDTKKLKYTF
jgi:hypothetical protein